MDLAKGKDIVFIGACRIGKSALFYVPLMAARLRFGQGLAILVVPTKALSKDQAKAANKRGLCTITINSDTLRDASCQMPQRKPFDEVAEGLWELIIVSPEMLKHPELNKKMQTKVFRDHIRFFGVDKFHLVQDHGEDFRSAYQEISVWRSCLPPDVCWIITTAMPPTGASPYTMLNSLRFKEPEYIFRKLPVDRPHINSSTMYDIAWAIPMSAKKPKDIPKCIIFCHTIEFGYPSWSERKRRLPGHLNSCLSQY
ncbi:hypothetical protein NEOLEDRAFT_1073830 [Neolentinus lepideus HHB14362 ss-1]|uniref:Helicase ATP-binding domain-containing protein n=1 Tax=Neolentinus lepideus HHB14362 ss-1 TaxID=1314782 RepID=A0A165PLQ7_9AGAM|nr:hypothetical protein NEOLEDRAFT_1073830 [Neolentinus lepideus HHB14362 ss-1]